MKVHLTSIGCRLNQSEIETMGRQLLAAGHEIVAEPAGADAVVVNTCAVTRSAARDARQLTRRIHRDNGAAEIILTGCYATIAPRELARLDGAPQIVVNRDKDGLVADLLARHGQPAERIELPLYEQEPVLRQFLDQGGQAGLARTRAFVKVQDGCDNRCTFCVTTIARGDGQSRHLGDVVAEIQALAAAGYQEAVLTGVHLGSYGHDLGQPHGLRGLVQAILDHTDIPRLRLSSLEPWDLSPAFFTLWDNPRLLPHLHLPLQSGSDPVLRRMARRTSRASFRELAAAAQAAIPDLNLSTDIIVGFPGESAADFADSLSFVQEIGFARLHVFPYSRRPGTAAARLPDQVERAEKKGRTRQMIALGRQLSDAFHRRYVGRTLPVLWEAATGADDAGLRWSGYTGNYIRVAASGPPDLGNKITPARLTAVAADGLLAEALPPNGNR